MMMIALIALGAAAATPGPALVADDAAPAMAAVPVGHGRWIAGTHAPGGWAAYHRPLRGWRLPAYWLAPSFTLGWEGYGLPAPQPGWRWTRYYDDAVLIDANGVVQDSRSGLDWNRYDGDGPHGPIAYDNDAYRWDDQLAGATDQPGTYRGTWHGRYEGPDHRVWRGEWQGDYTDANGHVVHGDWRGTEIGAPRGDHAAGAPYPAPAIDDARVRWHADHAPRGWYADRGWSGENAYRVAPYGWVVDGGGGDTTIIITPGAPVTTTTTTTTEYYVTSRRVWHRAAVRHRRVHHIRHVCHVVHYTCPVGS